MKKFLTVMLTALMALCLFGCSSGTSSDAGEQADQGHTIKVGVANIMTGESLEAIKNYYNNEVAGTLNMEFTISENLSNDASSLVNFIDQCYAAGCEGIINMITGTEAVEQGAQKCEQYGMWFATNNSAVAKNVAGLSHNIGHCGADPVGMEEAYKKAFQTICADGENHSVFMYTCAAPGMTAASHYYSAVGVLEAMKEVYGLTYTNSIEDIVNSQDPGEVAHDKMDSVHIYLCPGMDFSNFAQYVTAAQTQLQTGNYDIFAACANWANFTEAIKGCEASTGKSIKVVGTMNIEDQTKTGLGDGTIAAAIINPLNVANGVLAAMIYNASNGQGEAMKDGGNAVLLGVKPWAVMSASDYDIIANLDKEVGKFVLGGNGLKALTSIANPSVTYKDMNNTLATLADINAVVDFMAQ